MVRSGSVFCLFMHCLSSKEGQKVFGGVFFGQIWVSFMFIYALSDYVKGRSECIGGVFCQIWVSFLFIYVLSEYVKGRGEFRGQNVRGNTNTPILGQPMFPFCQVCS